MSKSINKCIFIGNVGKEGVDVRTFDSGDIKAWFSLACNESWKDKKTGEQKESVTWINVVAWGRKGELVAEYLRKGSRVYVEGKFKTESWEHEGQKKYKTFIDITFGDMMFLDNKQQASETAKIVRDESETPPANDSDIPF